MKQVPVIIREQSNREKLEVALIENVQRRNLNPIDKAEAFGKSKDQFGLLEKEIGKLAGTSREAIANSLRLLLLSNDIKRALKEEKISEGHARALLSAKDDKARSMLLEEVIQNGYSVRETERKAKEMNPKTERKNFVARVPEMVSEFLEKRIKQILNSENIKIEKKKNNIQVTMNFNSEEEMNEWLKKIKS